MVIKVRSRGCKKALDTCVCHKKRVILGYEIRRLISPTPMHKITKFLSEISTFLKQNNSDYAMFTLWT